MFFYILGKIVSATFGFQTLGKYLARRTTITTKKRTITKISDVSSADPTSAFNSASIVGRLLGDFATIRNPIRSPCPIGNLIRRTRAIDHRIGNHTRFPRLARNPGAASEGRGNLKAYPADDFAEEACFGLWSWARAAAWSALRPSHAPSSTLPRSLAISEAVLFAT